MLNLNSINRLITSASNDVRNAVRNIDMLNLSNIDEAIQNYADNENEELEEIDLNEEEILEQPETATSDYFIGRVFKGIYPSDAADWCMDHNAYIAEIEPIIEDDITTRRFEIKEIIIHESTPEQQRENRAIAYERYVAR